MKVVRQSSQCHDYFLHVLFNEVVLYLVSDMLLAQEMILQAPKTKGK